MKIVRTEEGGRNLVRAIVDRWVSRARSTQPTRTFAPPLVPTCKRGEPLYSCRFGCVSGEMKITTSPNPLGKEGNEDCKFRYRTSYTVA